MDGLVAHRGDVDTMISIDDELEEPMGTEMMADLVIIRASF